MSKNSTNAVTPVAKKRLALLKEMTPATREVAQDFETRLGKVAHGIILTQYDMGSRVAEVMENEGEYGSGAVKQLAEYLNVAGGETTLYALRNFSESFDKEYVKEYSLKPMGNGQFLSIGHWFKLMQLKDRKTQEKMLDRIFKESLTVNELEKEVRALGSKDKKNARQGGRKPATPTSPIAGLQTAFQLAQKWSNLVPVLEENVFDSIDELPPDRVNEALLEKLNETKEKIEEMTEKGQSALERVTANIERVETVLANKSEEGSEEDGDEEGEEEAPKKKSKKDKGSKAESNGEAEGGKKKGKKKKAKVAAE